MNRMLFNEAKKYLAGGVNSPARSFQQVGINPFFAKLAKGCRIYGEDGRSFVDYCLGFGALILGHAHPKVRKEIKKTVDRGSIFAVPTRQETDLAKLICSAIPSIEKVRLTNSGTEAVMTAIRLSRAYAKRNKIIKFEGCYHGHADYLLDCEGVPFDCRKDTIVIPYNDAKRAKETVNKFSKEIAAIIVEPIAGNMGVILPRNGFLQFLREIADKYKIVLIFDEVITGFRLSFGAAQDIFAVKPDLTCLGKIIGGGFPIGAVAGKKEILNLLAPEGSVYQAGTFSGNPISVNAGLRTLKILVKDNCYTKLEKMTKYLCGGIINIAKDYGFKIRVNFIGSMFSIFFTEKEVFDHASAKKQDTNLFKKFYQNLLEENIFFSPSPFEADFLSSAHTSKVLEKTLTAVEKSFGNLRRV